MPTIIVSVHTTISILQQIIFSWTTSLLKPTFTVFTRLNAVVFIKFLAFLMRCLFKGDIYFKIIFLISLTTITVNHL